MLDQFHSINQAAEILIGSGGTPQERLAKGFKAMKDLAVAVELAGSQVVIPPTPNLQRVLDLSGGSERTG